MNLKTRLLATIISLLFLACSENKEIIIEDNLLIGNWSEVTYDGKKITLQRVYKLPDEQYGMTFKEEFPTFLERTSGFCGTPPLTFFTVEGTWKLQENKLRIYDANIHTIDNTEPLVLHTFSIISLTEKELVLQRELTEQEKDHLELIHLYEEIQAIATIVICTNGDDWLLTPYGSKACGGPQGFLAYHKSIDVPKFLKKIEVYNKLEDEFNKKWGIISTCDLPAKPIKVECSNGAPMLKY